MTKRNRERMMAMIREYGNFLGHFKSVNVKFFRNGMNVRLAPRVKRKRKAEAEKATA